MAISLFYNGHKVYSLYSDRWPRYIYNLSSRLQYPFWESERSLNYLSTLIGFVLHLCILQKFFQITKKFLWVVFQKFFWHSLKSWGLNILHTFFNLSHHAFVDLDVFSSHSASPWLPVSLYILPPLPLTFVHSVSSTGLILLIQASDDLVSLVFELSSWIPSKHYNEYTSCS